MGIVRGRKEGVSFTKIRKPLGEPHPWTCFTDKMLDNSTASGRERAVPAVSG